jgi:hypothetical protein
MTTRHDPSSEYSGLLSLPTELRCQIYDYLLTDSHAVTISAGYMTIFGHRIQDRARKQDIPGLPLNLAPIVRSHYDVTLLSVAKHPEVPIDDSWMSSTAEDAGVLGMPAPLALSLTCRLVNDEMADHQRRGKAMASARAQSTSTETQETQSKVGQDQEGLSLHVTYPYGVLVLKNLYPYLLKQARRVYISGYYMCPQEIEPETPVFSEGNEEERLTPLSSLDMSFGASTPVQTSGRSCDYAAVWNSIITPTAIVQVNASRPRLRLDPPLPLIQRPASRAQKLFPAFSPTTAALAPAVLGQLVRTLLPPKPTQLVQLSARILYPGPDSYAVVWSDQRSPVSHILRNVCGGKIDMRIKRSALATGLTLTALPHPEARSVSTSWENWQSETTVGAIGIRRSGRRIGVSDLDEFLIAKTDKISH